MTKLYIPLCVHLFSLCAILCFIAYTRTRVRVCVHIHIYHIFMYMYVRIICMNECVQSTAKLTTKCGPGWVCVSGVPSIKKVQSKSRFEFHCGTHFRRLHPAEAEGLLELSPTTPTKGRRTSSRNTTAPRAKPTTRRKMGPWRCRRERGWRASPRVLFSWTSVCCVSCWRRPLRYRCFSPSSVILLQRLIRPNFREKCLVSVSVPSLSVLAFAMKIVRI